MYQVIDTLTQGIKGRWSALSSAQAQSMALNRAYGDRRYTVRSYRSPT